MTEEIVAIKIIGSNMSGISGGTSSGGASASGAGGAVKGLVGGMGGMLKGLMSALGVGSVVGIVVMIASQMKSLLGVIGQIIKMVAMIIKPIADVVMILLMPILMILKPIVMVVNQIMAPFIKLSMQLMREGMKSLAGGDSSGAAAMGAGISVAMLGLNSVIVGLLGGVIRLAIDLSYDMLKNALLALVSIMGALLGPLLGVFGIDITDQIVVMKEGITTGIGFLKDSALLGVDAIFGTVMAGLAGQAAMLGETFGVETSAFQTKALKNITNLFSGGDTDLAGVWKKQIGIQAGFGKIAKDAIDGVLGEKDGLSGEFTLKMGEFQTKGVGAVGSAVTALNAEWDKLKSMDTTGRKKTFGTFVQDSLLEIVTLGSAETGYNT